MLKYVVLVLLPLLAFADLEANLKKALDVDGDGKVSKAEAEQVFLSWDANKDGEITQAEFDAGVDKVDGWFKGHEGLLYGLLNRDGTGNVTKKDVDDTFDFADFNKNGYIDASELHIIASLAGTVGK